MKAAGEAVKQAKIAKSAVELKVAEEDNKLIQTRYLVGKSIALEDFDAALKVRQAKLAVIDAIYKYRLAQAQLIWARGDL